MKNTKHNKKNADYRNNFIKENYEAFTFRFNKEKDVEIIELLKNDGMKAIRNALNNYLIDCEYEKELNGGK